MKRVLIFQVFIIPMLMTLTWLAVTAGQALGRQSETFAGVQPCNLPCWNGIEPGKTPFQDAIDILASTGYRRHDEQFGAAIPNQTTYDGQPNMDVCQVGLSRVLRLTWVVSEMTLEFCGGSALGNIMHMLGEPQTVLPFVSMVTYKDGQVVVILRSRMCLTTLSPHNRILFISLTPPQTDPLNRVTLAEAATGGSNEDSTLLPWHGFMPTWRYNQLFPGRALC